MSESNSSRIEVATRKHVGAVLNSQMIAELVKVAFPDWKGGVYPSDCAYVRTSEGMKPRGKVAYGDGVLEYLSENSFKVLPTTEIVRHPSTRKKAAAVVPAPEPAKTEKKGKKGSSRPTPAATTSGSQTSSSAGRKKAATTASQIPVATKQKGADRRAAL